jgi:GT2 family glycosyltransferase
MPPSCALVIVNFYSSALTSAAINSAQNSTTAPLRVIVVDNSCSREELAALSHSGADRVLAAPRNLGYAGGINHALREDDTAELIIVSNPDVVFFPRCIDSLIDAVQPAGVGVAGPRFSWDSNGRWLIPPADEPSLVAKEDEIRARRSSGWERWRQRRLLRRRITFWTRESPAVVPALSGAVMAFVRETWKSVDGFDERYPLYFEEVDFVRTLRRARLKALHVPEAGCRHIYDQSASSSAESRRLFSISESEFFRKWYGAWYLKRLGMPHPTRDQRAWKPFGGSVSIPQGEEPSKFLVELSPMAGFETAVGHFPTSRSVEIPDEILATYNGDSLYVRLVELNSLRIVDSWMWSRSR